MKKRFWLAFGIAVLAGTGLHFLYDVCPVPLVGLFAPVNESVWEHLKLFFWPTLAAAFVLTRKNEDGQRAWSGWLLAELVMPVLCMGVFYMLSCGFGVEALWVDIALYVLVMAAGFNAAQRGPIPRYTSEKLALAQSLAASCCENDVRVCPL